MKQVSLAFLLAVLVSSSALAQAQAELVDQLHQSVADTFKTKTMSSLDRKKLIQGSLLVRIVHSLMEGKGSIVRRQFSTFAQVDAWLKKRETEEGGPFRQVSEVVKCSKGHCAYNYNNGILHNQLYLHDIYYRFRNGKPYITRIDLLDGD